MFFDFFLEFFFFRYLAFIDVQKNVAMSDGVEATHCTTVIVWLYVILYLDSFLFVFVRINEKKD